MLISRAWQRSDVHCSTSFLLLIVDLWLCFLLLGKQAPVGLMSDLECLLFGRWPLHWINLPLRKGNSDFVFFEAAPDHLAKIAFNLKCFQGIPDPEKNFVIDGRIRKTGCEGCWSWVRQNLFMFFGEFDKNVDYAARFMVIGSSNIHGTAT